MAGWTGGPECALETMAGKSSCWLASLLVSGDRPWRRWPCFVLGSRRGMITAPVVGNSREHLPVGKILNFENSWALSMSRIGRSRACVYGVTPVDPGRLPNPWRLGLGRILPRRRARGLVVVGSPAAIPTEGIP